MPFEFIQIPANGQGNAQEELNLAAAWRAALRQRGRSLYRTIERGGLVLGLLHRVSGWPDGPMGGEKGRMGSGPKVDYKEELSIEDFAVFSRLRDLRKAISGKEAIPAQSLF